MTWRTAELFEGTVDAITDEEREIEKRIAEASFRIWYSKSRDMKAAAVAELRILHKQRSEAQIARLERQRGLRP